MSKPCDEEHQFSGFVAGVRGAVTKIHPSRAQRPGASLDGGADALGGADGFDGGMG